jgi:hypothetical protein
MFSDYYFTKNPNDLRNLENIYGFLVSRNEQGREIPIICGCGGDKWLCFKCACKIVQFEGFENEITTVTTVCPVCPICGRPIYLDSDWVIHEKAKKNLIAIHSMCKRSVA